MSDLKISDEGLIEIRERLNVLFKEYINSEKDISEFKELITLSRQIDQTVVVPNSKLQAES